MPPGEGQSQRPLQGRPPYPRYRPSIDGVMPPPAQRSTPIRADGDRAIFGRRPTMPIGRPPEVTASVPAQTPYTPPPPAAPDTPLTPIPNPTPQFQPPATPLPPVAPQPQQYQSAALAPVFNQAPAPYQSSSPSPSEPAAAALPSAFARPALPAPEPELALPAVTKRRRLRLPKLSPATLRRLRSFTLSTTVAIAVIGGALALFHFHSVSNSPDTIFQNALKTAFSTKQLTSVTTTPSQTTEASFDFSNLTDPLVTTQATVQLAGASFGIQGYGSIQNTYISYTKLPSTVATNISSLINNGWVQLRAKGVEPTGVSATLSQLADPRYQAFGPVVFGNFSPATQKTLVNFIKAHNIYAYHDTAVGHATINGKKVLTYPVTFNISYLQILIDSAASSEAIGPNDVQAVVDQLATLKGAKVTFYINPSTHQLVRVTIDQNGQVTTISYSNYNHVSLPNEPETQLTWADFQPVQLQMEAQVASHETTQALDAQRKADLAQLHSFFANYFLQNAFYPLPTNVNDQNWVETILAGADPDIFHDPLGTTLQVAAKPTVNMYAYETFPASGNGTCNNTVTNPCVHYKLTATLSNGQQYVVTDP